MDSDNPLWGIAIILLLILVMAIMSCIKAAMEYVNENTIRKKAEEGNKKALVLLDLIGTDTKYQGSLSLMICAVEIITGVFFLTYLLQGLGLLVNFISLTLLIFIMTLFGLILPKKLALKYSEQICFGLYGLICLFFMVTGPFTWIIDKIMTFLLRIFGISAKEILVNEIEEEIISMVNEGHEQGVIDAGKAEMISNIIELDDKAAEDIMTHKKRIVAVDGEMTIEEALKFMLSKNYSRYPLYVDNLDNIVGILHLKDIISAYISKDSKNIRLQDIAREPFFYTRYPKC